MACLIFSRFIAEVNGEPSDIGMGEHPYWIPEPEQDNLFPEPEGLPPFEEGYFVRITTTSTTTSMTTTMSAAPNTKVPITYPLISAAPSTGAQTNFPPNPASSSPGAPSTSVPTSIAPTSLAPTTSIVTTSPRTTPGVTNSVLSTVGTTTPLPCSSQSCSTPLYCLCINSTNKIVTFEQICSGADSKNSSVLISACQANGCSTSYIQYYKNQLGYINGLDLSYE